MGENAEKKFFIFCSKYPNITIRNATKYEELVYHYDYVLQIKENNNYLYSRLKIS